MRHRRLPRFDLPGRSYYLGCCVHGRRPLFRQEELARLLLDLYVSRRDSGAIALHGYVIMPAHYHVLVTLRAAESISGLVRGVHSLFARACRERTGLRGRLWQRRFYDHVIRDEEDWRTKLAYTHENPVRAGLVRTPTEHEWSSARFWEMGGGTVECEGIVW